MSETRAVPLDLLAERNHDRDGTGRPLCPGCKLGYLHPYLVRIHLDGFERVDYLDGWVAICRGNAEENRRTAALYKRLGEEPGDLPEHQPCGFTMALTPHQFHRG